MGAGPAGWLTCGRVKGTVVAVFSEDIGLQLRLAGHCQELEELDLL